MSARVVRPPKGEVSPAPTGTAPLLFWLVVVAGLVGYSVLHARDPGTPEWKVMDDLLPVWVGTLGGVAVGQLFGILRIRAWVLAVLGLLVISGPGLALYGVLHHLLGYEGREAAWRAFVAFLPAAVSGYLALSPRGALVAFWYPTTLWMVAILDGQTSAETFDRAAATPFVVGLGALLVAFLRARETRRAALWRTQGSVEIAPARARNVLRASPLRGASEHLGAALLATGALVLTAWVAPHLWQVDKIDRAGAAAVHASTGVPAAPRACDAPPEPKKVERVREYFQLRREVDAERELVARWAMPCVPSQAVATTEDLSGYESYSWGYYTYGEAHGTTYTTLPTNPPTNVTEAPLTTAPGSAAPSQVTTGATGTTYTLPSYSPDPIFATPPDEVAPKPHASPAPHVTDTAPPKPPAVPSPTPVAKQIAPEKPEKPAATSSNAPTAAKTSATGHVATPAVAPPPSPSAPLGSAGAPWRWTLVLCAIAFGAHLSARAIRRALVLRHLERPFWSETVDQRISNHWERMLIALRDAGVAPLRDEAPAAFAKRVGLAGMETCAEILERVRHGVGVEPLDLETMARSSASVSEAAQRRASAVARALAWVRPLT